VCLCVNQRGTNCNLYMYTLVMLHGDPDISLQTFHQDIPSGRISGQFRWIFPENSPPGQTPRTYHRIITPNASCASQSVGCLLFHVTYNISAHLMIVKCSYCSERTIRVLLLLLLLLLLPTIDVIRCPANCSRIGSIFSVCWRTATLYRRC